MSETITTILGYAATPSGIERIDFKELTLEETTDLEIAGTASAGGFGSSSREFLVHYLQFLCYKSIRQQGLDPKKIAGYTLLTNEELERHVHEEDINPPPQIGATFYFKHSNYDDAA